MTPSTQAQNRRSEWQTLRAKTKKGYYSFIRSRLSPFSNVHNTKFPTIELTISDVKMSNSIGWLRNSQEEGDTYWKGEAEFGGIS